MEQTMRQIREMISVAEALLSINPKEAQAHYEKMEPLWIRLRAEREDDIKAKQDKSCPNWAKLDANREERKADMKAFNEMMTRREVERKADFEKMMAERNADQEKREDERKVGREMATKLGGIHNKTDAN
jgi:hypothetical protein